MRLLSNQSFRQVLSKLVFILLFPSLANCQISCDSNIINFSKKTIQHHFSNPLIIKGQERFSQIIIKTGIDSSCLIKEVDKFKFLYLSKGSLLPWDLNWPLKKWRKNKGRKIYTMNYIQEGGGDTVYIVITAEMITEIGRNYTALHQCELMGGRFTLNKVTNDWDSYFYDNAANCEYPKKKKRRRCFK